MQESPPLAQIIEVINHESINLFSEHLIKQIAFEKTGLGNLKGGIEIIEEFWKKRGVSTESIFIEDGSGLSHFNAVSPQFFTQVLAKMYQNSWFVASLPTAGEGTLYLFNKKNFDGRRSF